MSVLMFPSNCCFTWIESFLWWECSPFGAGCSVQHWSDKRMTNGAGSHNDRDHRLHLENRPLFKNKGTQVLLYSYLNGRAESTGKYLLFQNFKGKAA